MSIRACRITRVETADYVTFNLTEDSKLVGFLSYQQGVAALAADGTAMVGVPVEALQRAIKLAKNLGMDQGVVEALRRDVAAAKRKGDDCVDYLLW